MKGVAPVSYPKEYSLIPTVGLLIILLVSSAEYNENPGIISSEGSRAG